eukprot:comp15596_c0_seq1/m.12712 comp15596_c0_seq1/g.12712  ORF comp15596_c0_seq1/g.12712 comp15596_c0_seq1/m.12712 type:complete len:495 (-) comp15596_c0_seq1:53-1537(-)
MGCSVSRRWRGELTPEQAPRAPGHKRRFWQGRGQGRQPGRMAKAGHDMRAYQRELWPHVDPDRLPSSWSPKDFHQKLELSHGNLRAKYIGPGKSDSDAAAVRANNPIPPSCGVYYYEVTITSKGRDGYIGIGLSDKTVKLDRLPGWEKNSYGYHGDDGHSFKCSGQGQAYGPTFTTGDVIGCCINFVDQTCFYTKNGVHQGIAFTGLKGALYPSVGMRTPQETLHVNFGQEPFHFDLKTYMQEVRASTLATVKAIPLSDCLPLLGTAPTTAGTEEEQASNAWPTALNTLISSYLVHHGYAQTAEIFTRDTGVPIREETTSITNRQRIKADVLAGRIDDALALTEATYPGMLAAHRDLHFRLKRQKFIEMVAANTTKGDGNMGEIIAFGKQLQAECPESEGDMRKSLVEAFGMLAYKDLSTSPMAYLLDVTQREAIAEDLNSCILGSQNLPAAPALETVVRQVDACLRASLEHEVGAAAFVGIDTLMPPQSMALD